MSRSMLIVLAVLALLLSVSAQSNPSSSSSSSSSSSAAVAPSSSSSFSSSSPSTPSSSSSSSATPISSSSSSSGAATGVVSNFTSSSSSSSSGGSAVNRTSSSSSSSSSTGGVIALNASSSSSSSSSAFIPVTPTSSYPLGSYYVSLYAYLSSNSSALNAAVGAPLLQRDIAFNIANVSSTANNTISYQLLLPYVLIQSYNGQTLAPASRRLLQNSNQTTVSVPFSFILLGNVTNIVALNTTAAVYNFAAAAAAGTLQAPFSNATIPAQPVTAVVPGSYNPYSSSSGVYNNTGTGSNGASCVASASAALVFATVASLALLL